MKKLLLITTSLLCFSGPLWATDPRVLCDEDVIGDLTPSKQDLVLEACQYAGQYQDSLLPDQNASPSGQFHQGVQAIYNYSEFFKILNKSVVGINKKDCHTAPGAFGSSGIPATPFPTVILQKTAVGQIPISILDEKQIQQVFQDISHDPQYTFNSPEEGCWARAQIMAQELEKKGIRVGKIFVEGDLLVDSKNALNGKNVRWSYHVAPVVAVHGRRGLELQVIDPSLFDKPIPVKTWVDKLLQHASEQNKADVYMTDRFVFQALRSTKIKSLVEDPARGRWHKAETVLARQELDRLQLDSEDTRDWKIEQQKMLQRGN